MRELTSVELEAVSGGGSLVELIVDIATSRQGQEIGETLGEALKGLGH